MLTRDVEKRPSASILLKDQWLNKEKNTFEKNILESSLNNMMQFASKNKLQKAIFMHLISTYSNTEETKKLYEIFQVLDTDGNGVLSK